ncbi:MAG: hypothetical protein JNK16_09135 [Phycisphaerales bacterium]|nr:hypothetical protein [Phycisphaerales bacterium]
MLTEGTVGARRVVGWSMLGVAAIVAAALAFEPSERSNASLAINLAEGQDGQNPPDPKMPTPWTDAFAKGSGVSLTSDGTFFVDIRKTQPRGKISRTVDRFRALRFADGKQSKTYSLLVTANQQDSLKGWSFTKKDLKRPVLQPDHALAEDEEETGLVMPDEGTVVIYGNAPLIGVRRATVSSVGTTFAIEADSTGWLIRVIAVSANNDPVLVYFPESPIRQCRQLYLNDCVRYENSAEKYNDDTPGEAGACVSLNTYAAALLAAAGGQ